MENNITNIKEKLLVDFESNREIIFGEINGSIRKARENAFGLFVKEGIPHNKLEDWRYTDLNNAISPNYVQNFKHPKREVEFEDIFRCDVPKLDTHLIEILNGWYPKKNDTLQELEDGVIVGSFAEAIKHYPELIAKHYDRYANDSRNGLLALNTAMANDGVFIYVPDNVVSKKTIQY